MGRELASAGVRAGPARLSSLTTGFFPLSVPPGSEHKANREDTGEIRQLGRILKCDAIRQKMSETTLRAPPNYGHREEALVREGEAENQKITHHFLNILLQLHKYIYVYMYLYICDIYVYTHTYIGVYSRD